MNDGLENAVNASSHWRVGGEGAQTPGEGGWSGGRKRQPGQAEERRSRRRPSEWEVEQRSRGRAAYPTATQPSSEHQPTQGQVLGNKAEAGKPSDRLRGPAFFSSCPLGSLPILSLQRARDFLRPCSENPGAEALALGVGLPQLIRVLTIQSARMGLEREHRPSRTNCRAEKQGLLPAPCFVPRVQLSVPHTIGTRSIYRMNCRMNEPVYELRDGRWRMLGGPRKGSLVAQAIKAAAVPLPRTRMRRQWSVSPSAGCPSLSPPLSLEPAGLEVPAISLGLALPVSARKSSAPRCSP